MKLSFQKELAIKKAILYGTENNVSITNYADGFGVSKSTIYKYRRILVDQGFIVKEPDGSYSIVENKYSKKASTKPKVHTLDLSFTDDDINQNVPKIDSKADVITVTMDKSIQNIQDSDESIDKKISIAQSDFSKSNNIKSDSNVELVIVNNKNNNYRKKVVKEVSKNKNFVKTIISKLTRR